MHRQAMAAPSTSGKRASARTKIENGKLQHEHYRAGARVGIDLAAFALKGYRPGNSIINNIDDEDDDQRDQSQEEAQEIALFLASHDRCGGAWQWERRLHWLCQFRQHP
jgi:hypothetical protein